MLLCSPKWKCGAFHFLFLDFGSGFCFSEVNWLDYIEKFEFFFSSFFGDLGSGFNLEICKIEP